MKKMPPTKYDRLSWLLRVYGDGEMDDKEFWEQMKQSGYGQDDIDQWCVEYHKRKQS